MKPYTQLNQAQILRIAEVYGVGVIDEVQILSGGSENSNYLLQEGKHSSVLTIYDRKTLRQVNQLAQLLDHLGRNEFGTNKIIPTSHGAMVHQFQQKPVTLKSFLPGRVPIDLSKDELILLGMKMADLHLVPPLPNMSKNITYGLDKFYLLEATHSDHPFYYWLQEIKAQVEASDMHRLPLALIHADIFTNNLVIAAGEGVQIIDFEEACHFAKVFDLGMAIVGVCCPKQEFSASKVRWLLDGYLQVGRLSPLEQEHLQLMAIYAAAATGFWRFRQFNVLEPREELKLHYLKMKQIAEQLMAVSRKDFLA